MTEYSNFLMENEGAKHFGLEPQSRELHRETAGMEFVEAMAVRFPGCDPKEVVDYISTVVQPKFISEGKADTISNATYNALAELKEKGFKLHVLTSRSKAILGHILDSKHRLHDYMERFFYLENTVYSKPDPRVFDIPIMQLNCKPEECLYVGDSVLDECAKDAG